MANNTTGSWRCDPRTERSPYVGYGRHGPSFVRFQTNSGGDHGGQGRDGGSRRILGKQTHVEKFHLLPGGNTTAREVWTTKRPLSAGKTYSPCDLPQSMWMRHLTVNTQTRNTQQLKKRNIRLNRSTKISRGKGVNVAGEEWRGYNWWSLGDLAGFITLLLPKGSEAALPHRGRRSRQAA